MPSRKSKKARKRIVVVFRRRFPEFVGRVIRDAELYASARHPLPVCHPGTRTSLIQEINEWMESGDFNLLWVHGPAGAGKTAVAQTIGEAVDVRSESLQLLAAFFFSRPRNHNDPTSFWTSICYQILGRRLSLRFDTSRFRDPAVIEADIQTQFEKLVIPLLIQLDTTSRARIIIIDGLDECRGEEEQCQIIKTICDAIPRVPFVRWLVFSRPEPHLKRAFEVAHSQDLCHIIEVRTDDPETRGDIERYLKDGFAKISKTYLKDQIANWPKAEDLEKIFRAASGIFVYVATILKFVDDPTTRNPVSQLQTVIDFIDGSPLPPGATNPLAFIDKLYLEIIGRTRKKDLPTTLLVLGTLAVCPPLPALHLAHLVGLDMGALYDALRCVHSLIAVPSEGKVSEEPLRYFHASFSDFLMNPTRSGHLAQDPDDCRLQLAEILFRMLDTPEVVYVDKMSHKSWHDEDDGIPPPLSIHDTVVTYASMHVWDILSKPPVEFVRARIGTFNFRCLESVMETIPPLPFIKFLRWLYQWTMEFAELRGLVRSTPHFDFDTQLISACEPLAQPLNIKSQLWDELEESPRYVIVGFRDQIVIILITHETVIVYGSPEGLEEDRHLKQ